MGAGGPLRGAAWPDPANPATMLSDVEVAVSRQYPVPEVTNSALETLRTHGEVAILDVREATEFDESHIEGALRVEPSLSTEQFISRFGNEIMGKQVVFYCSVGVRSGQFLERTLPVLQRAGVTAAYNLRGGIFRWFARGGRVVAQLGVAHSVHPYDTAWGQLLARTIAAAHAR